MSSDRNGVVMAAVETTSGQCDGVVDTSENQEGGVTQMATKSVAK
jgi:hypothetical protein